jgi:hypothetical protein
MSRSARLSIRALRARIIARDRAYYEDIIRQYAWPVSAIRASSPAGVQPIETVTRFSRRCECVTYDWLADDIGWQPTPDQQGALLRHRSERVSLACVVQHVHGGLTGWYFRPKIPPKLVEWLCPVELRLRTQKECQSAPGDEVIWMVRE